MSLVTLSVVIFWNSNLDSCTPIYVLILVILGWLQCLSITSIYIDLLAIITVTSQGTPGVLNQRLFDCLITILFRIITKNTSNLDITGILGAYIGGRWIPLTTLEWHNNDCSSFIRHLWQSTKHIKWSSKIVHKNNTIRAYNQTTYITRGYSASQVSCTHVLVVWISSNQFHVSHLGKYWNWCLYMVLPQCQWRRKLGWQAHVLTHGNTQYI